MSYGFSAKITIDHTKCGSSDSTSFPMLFLGTFVNLKTTANGGSVQNTVAFNGFTVPADLIFTSDAAGTSLLNWDLAAYTPSTGAIQVWIQIPTLSHTSDTVIYMFAGNAAITTYQGGAVGAAYDSHFKAVYHLESQAQATDSTAANLPGTVNSATSGTGEINFGINFSGSSQYIGMGNVLDPAGNPFTWAAWIKPPNSTQYGYIIAKRDGSSPFKQAEFLVGTLPSGSPTNSKKLCLFITDGTTQQSYRTTNDVADNAWHRVAAVRQASGAPIIYVDGVAAALTADNAYTGSALNCSNTKSFNLGYDNTSAYYTGLMDEVHISDSVRGADWMLADFNNQSSPSTFYAVLILNTLSAATSSFAATLPRRTGKVLAAATASFAATLPRMSLKLLAAATASFAGAVTKITRKLLTAATASFAATLTTAHIFAQALNAAMTSFAGAITKQTGKLLSAATASFAAVLPKITYKSLAAATSSFAASLPRMTGHAVAAAMSSLAGAVAKQTNRIVTAATASFAATLDKAHKFAIGLDAAMASFAGAVTKQTRRILSAANSAWAATLDSILSSAGTMYTQALDAAMASFAGAILKKTARTITAATASFAGSLPKITLKTISAATASFAGAVTKQTGKLLAVATASFAAVLTKSHVFAAALNAAMASFAGGLTKRTAKAINGAMSSFVGTVNKRTSKTQTAAMSAFHGVVSNAKNAIDFIFALGGYVVGAIFALGGSVSPRPAAMVSKGGEIVPAMSALGGYTTRKGS